MDSAPLNLAHFHERRAERFMRHHRYDEAIKALETSLLYLQDAYKLVTIGKSVEVLNTLKWDFERKLQQIQMRKQQHERLKNREIVPLSEINSVLLPRQDNQAQNATPQLIARSIDKAIAKFNKSMQEEQQQQVQLLPQQQQNVQELHENPCKIRNLANKENVQQHKLAGNEVVLQVNLEQMQQQDDKHLTKWRQRACSLTTQQSEELSIHFDDDLDELPTLAPLELPMFDYNVFTTSAPSLACMLKTDELNEHLNLAYNN